MRTSKIWKEMNRIAEADGAKYAMAYGALRVLGEYPCLKEAIGRGYWPLLALEEDRQDAITLQQETEAEIPDAHLNQFQRRQLMLYLRDMIKHAEGVPPYGPDLNEMRELSIRLGLRGRFQEYLDATRAIRNRIEATS